MSLNRKAIRVLGNKNPKPIRVPHNNAVPRLIFGNTIMEMKNCGGWITYFAFGRVVKICKSDKFDLVFVDFGGNTEENYKVYFHTLQSRKQIYTLKVGQYAQFGMIRRSDCNEKTNDLFIALWAMGIYVPKMVDIRNSELAQDEISEMSQEEYGEGVTFLDLFKKND